MTKLSEKHRWQYGALRKKILQDHRLHRCDGAINGEVLDYFVYWLKVFIGPKQREVSMGNFHRKAPNCPNIGSECQKLTK